MRTRIFLASLAAAFALTACNDQPEPPAAEPEVNPQQVWWDRMQELCGQAFAGEMVSYDEEMDTGWLDVDVIMHVRECSETEIRIPLHVGENRSRTWVLTRTVDGIQLKHDHRYPDGSEETMSQYGGTTVDSGTESRQEFPAGDFSKALFEAENHPDGLDNTWAMEIHAGERFSYQLFRFNRDFQGNFDLSNPVDAPPPPWVVAPEQSGDDDDNDADD
jgi:hypothetical protein